MIPANVTPTDWLSTVLRLPRSQTILHGVRITREVPSPDLVDSATFVFVGRLVATKGVGVLLAAAQNLNNKGYIFRVRIIGDGPDRGAAEYIVRKKKLTRDVHFLGKQDRVYQHLAQADLFLLPSDMESFGLAALEAMACEVPVVATNVGGLPEVVEHGIDGYLFTPREVDIGARYAMEILSRPDRGREMGKAARLNAKKKYCANDVIPMYESYYRQVIDALTATHA